MAKTFTTVALVFAFSVFFHRVGAQGSSGILPPQVWLRADKEASLTGSVWHDVSGNARDAKVSASKMEDMKYFNFNPSKSFSDSAPPANIPYSLEGLSEMTFMIVYQSGDTTERGLIGTKNGAERNIMVTTNRVLGPDSVIDVFEAANNFVTMTTIAQSWEDAKIPGEGASLTFGSIEGNSEVKAFDGAIAELLVFDKVLPFLNRVQYETYLAIKYGIPLKDRNYVSSQEAVLWKAEDNTDFHFRITGIGRDDYFDLYQPQSTSSLDSGQLLLMTAADGSDKDKTAIADQDFVLFGDNDLQLETSKGEGPDSILSILDRKWLVTAAGRSVSTIPTALQLDLTQLPKDSLGFWLVIDRSGTGNFSVDNLEYFKADSISGDSIAYFNNIQWDTDLSGKDNFSFARMKDLFAVVRTLNQPICTDPKTGKVKIEVITGDSPFDFAWSLAGSEQPEHFTSKDSVVINRLVAGTYHLNVTDAQGTVFARDMILDMANGIPVDLGPDQALDKNKEIILDAGASVPDSAAVEYYWESSFGFRSSSAKIAVTESGIYRVFITNKANGCVFSDDITISGSPIQRFEVFPNLLHQGESFNVGISLEEPTDVQLRIFDLKGNLYSDMQGKGRSEYQFETSLQKSGHYTIVLETPEGASAKKIIVY